MLWEGRLIYKMVIHQIANAYIIHRVIGILENLPNITDKLFKELFWVAAEAA